MKIIFLDIDGVLNCMGSKSRCQGFIGIDNDKVKRLKQIVDATDAKIVLTSTWKLSWNKNSDLNNYSGNYLNRKLKRQNLFIMDKTIDNGMNRGTGIINFINKFHTKIENWIVIDDEYFPDYRKTGVLEHMVKTDFNNNGGLQDRHVELAINLLNKENEHGLEK